MTFTGSSNVPSTITLWVRNAPKEECAPMKGGIVRRRIKEMEEVAKGAQVM
jgi:hypothetical protein